MGTQFTNFAENLVTNLTDTVADTTKSKEQITQRYFLDSIKPGKIELDWELLKIEQWQTKLLQMINLTDLEKGSK